MIWWCIFMIFAPFSLFVSAATWTVGQPVNTTSGIYKGHESSLRPGVSEYLGIRYGLDTSGARRFAKPVPFRSQESFNADKYSVDCPSILTNITGAMAAIAVQAQATNLAGEDCLSINVWTKPQTGEKRKAVMVWVYGGGFNVGTAQDKMFDGSIFVDEEDVVIVTLNYRLVIFGFPSGIEGVDKNLGLRDQRLATEWVKENIENFGGDPNRVVLFGQSAGGFSVDNYAYAWATQKDPIISGIIAQSGTASMKEGGMVTPGNPQAWQSASKALGCPTEGKASLDCVRGKPWLDVLNAIRGGPTLSGGAMSGFSPTIDNEVAFGDYPSRTKIGQIIKVPLLAGCNDNEAGAGMLSVLGGKQDAQAISMQNAGFSCPPARAVDVRRQQQVPAWRYRFMAAYPNTEPMPGAGAVHGGELTLVWGTMDTARPNTKKSTAEENALSKIMMKAWATFAKDPKGGLETLGWPVYDGTKPTLVILGDKNRPERSFVDPVRFDSACDAYWKSNFTLGPAKGPGVPAA